MRTYILTDRERTLIEAFLETQEITPDDYNLYCQLRHQFRKNNETIHQDFILLEKFMNTTRKPKCFGTEDVIKKTTERKSTQCDAAAKCLGAYMRSKDLIP